MARAKAGRLWASGSGERVDRAKRDVVAPGSWLKTAGTGIVLLPTFATLPKDSETLVGRIQTTSDALRQDALSVINRSVTARAWLTGYYIVEYEQHGADRAKYGEGLLKKLAARLSGVAFALASLKNYRKFYLLYPELGEPVAGYLLSHFGKGQSLIGQLAIAVGDATQKSQSAIGLSRGDSLLVESGDALKISPDVLFNRLSFTHILQLLSLADDLQRTFYAFEAIRGTWSVRELQRQIESLYYARSGWSKNPRKLAQLTQVKAEKLNAADFVKADTVLEFLNLQAKDVWEEKDLAVPLKEESAGAAGAAAGEEAGGGSIVRELNRASSYFV